MKLLPKEIALLAATVLWVVIAVALIWHGNVGW